jgi:RNA polymerase sigma-70 factor (ECF subfamily)
MSDCDFETIYKTYFSDVNRYALSLTRDSSRAEEITEETFFRALRTLSSFRGECEIRIWLCHIARNIWLTEQKKRERLDVDEIPEELPEDDDFTEKIADRQEALEIHRVLHDLEEPYKEVFALRAFSDLSHQQIGLLFDKTDAWACHNAASAGGWHLGQPVFSCGRSPGYAP